MQTESAIYDPVFLLITLATETVDFTSLITKRHTYYTYTQIKNYSFKVQTFTRAIVKIEFKSRWTKTISFVEIIVIKPTSITAVKCVKKCTYIEH